MDELQGKVNYFRGNDPAKSCGMSATPTNVE
jgi:hypothetical protein